MLAKMGSAPLGNAMREHKGAVDAKEWMQEQRSWQQEQAQAEALAQSIANIPAPRAQALLRLDKSDADLQPSLSALGSHFMAEPP